VKFWNAISESDYLYSTIYADIGGLVFRSPGGRLCAENRPKSAKPSYAGKQHEFQSPAKLMQKSALPTPFFPAVGMEAGWFPSGEE
jgi:hypothetical protein